MSPEEEAAALKDVATQIIKGEPSVAKLCVGYMLLTAASDWKKHGHSNGRTSAQLRDLVFKFLREHPEKGRGRKLTNSAWADTPQRAVHWLDGQSFTTTSGTTRVAITCTVRQHGKQRLFTVAPSFQAASTSDAGVERRQVRTPLVAADDLDLHVEMLARTLSRRGVDTTASDLLEWIVSRASRLVDPQPKTEGSAPLSVPSSREQKDSRIQRVERKRSSESGPESPSSSGERKLVPQIAGVLHALVDADRGIIFLAAMGAVEQLLSDAELDLAVLTDGETHRFRSRSSGAIFHDLIFLRLASAIADAVDVIVTAHAGTLRFDKESLAEVRGLIAERLHVENSFMELFANMQERPYSRSIPEGTKEIWTAIRGTHPAELLTFAQLGRDVEDHWP